MPKWARAFLISTAATALAALALKALPGWKNRGAKRRGAPRRSREDVIDELSDEEKERLLGELGQHV